MTIVSKPLIACFSGNDPTGGAGIQADIESIHHFGCHALPLITVNTIQDSQGIQACQATNTHFLKQQFSVLDKDMSVNMIKAGLLGSVEHIDFLSHLLQEKKLPCVLDTIFSSGLGSMGASDEFISAFCTHLIPRAFIITPNYPEALKISACVKLTPSENPEILAKKIAEYFQTHVLLTGTHFENHTKVHHFLAFPHNNTTHSYTYPRLQANYHGSGCTLSSALAALLAQGKTLTQACELALDFTYQSLLSAQALGQHQLFPNR